MNRVPIRPACELQAKAADLLAQRRVRARPLFEDLHRLGEAGWYMLLDLYAADGDGRTISTTSICGASYSPPTTALRHLDHLMRQGLIRSAADPRDARRRIIEISPRGRRLMSAYLAAI